MAIDPERPVEKALRACAKKRREAAGAPFELHPATRRLLQGEVGRRYGRPYPAARSLLAICLRLWPGLGWSVATLVALGLAASLMFPSLTRSQKPSLLAKNENQLSVSDRRALQAGAPVLTAAEAGKRVDRPRQALAGSTESADTKDQVQSLLKPTETDKEKAREEIVALAADSGAPDSGTMKKVEVAQSAPFDRATASAAAENAPAIRRYGLAQNSGSPSNTPPAPTSSSIPATGLAASTTQPTPESRANSSGGELSSTDSQASRAGAALARRSVSRSGNATADAFGGAVAKDGRDGKLSQRFVQVKPPAKTKFSLLDGDSSTGTLLVSFQVKQSDSQVWVIDQDGSVYSGFVELPNDVSRQRSASQPRAATDLEPKPATSLPEGALQQAQKNWPGYYFRVAGTNRSLNQNVVFTGSFVPGTNGTALASAPDGVGGGVGGAAAPAAKQANLFLLYSHITGKASIGDAQPIEINAIPAPQ